MIKYFNKSFHIETDDTMYLMKVSDSGHLMNLHYGEKFRYADINTLLSIQEFEHGSSTSYSTEFDKFSLGKAHLEFSTTGKGDYRSPSCHLMLSDGTSTTDFRYKSHRIIKEKPDLSDLPASYGNSETLEIILSDEVINVEAVLLYTVFKESNIITRSAKLLNHGNDEICINKIMSFNLDIDNDNYELLTLDGAWARERYINRSKIRGITGIDSKKGVSSADHNPSMIILDKDTNDITGSCYGMSLIYSGNFEGVAQVDQNDNLRVMMGINSFDFNWYLGKNEEFQTPEVVLTYSNEGLNKLRSNFHMFVNENIIRGEYKYKTRPVLINNWEGTYFDFTEKKLLGLGKKAKKLGVELFVLDDGWFGCRDDDTKGLGDYHTNKKKLPDGLPALVEKINGIGLDFGIWVEPEMVNEESELYKKHPEWAIKLPNRKVSYGRNQLVLDLTNGQVQEYIVNQLSILFDSSNIAYCKWDMNRNLSDVYSSALNPKERESYFHRYTIGLYKILNRITQKFPKILFESCASGGNRFDLGMLCYMPQIWTSDNTDALCRQDIQEGTSLIYPQSAMGCHVSSAPNHQTFRNTSIETRFNVAAFGVLGYEMDLTTLNKIDEIAIANQIKYYKEHRKLLQFGKFSVVKTKDENIKIWEISSEDHTELISGYYQTLSKPNYITERLKAINVNHEFDYNIVNRKQTVDIRQFGDLINHEIPIKLKVNGLLHNTVANNYVRYIEEEKLSVSGSQINKYGVITKQNFYGTGFNERIRIMTDFDSRMFYLKVKR